MCQFMHTGHEQVDEEERQQAFVGHATKFGGIVLVCLAIWLLTGAGYFWPAWVIVIGGFKLGAHARAAYSGRVAERVEV